MADAMTDAEVWLEIAEHMRGSGFLPTCTCGFADGLCVSLACAAIAGVINTKQKYRMISQLEAKYGRNKPYFWPQGKINPRILACEELAKECMRNG